MPYVINAPNAAQSPALFPAQGNENFRRLKDIINNDHNFLNSSNPGTQGIHKQVTLINRTTPTLPLAGGDAVLYTKADSLGRAQLWMRNNTFDIPITALFPLSGITASLAPGASQTVLTVDVSKRCQGTLYAQYTGTTSISYGLVARDPAPTGNLASVIQLIGPTPPIGEWSTPSSGVLQVRNASAIPQTIYYSLIINVTP